MLNHIKTNDIPLVICTIADQPSGTLILNDEDYQVYITSPQAIQDIVSASYIIVSPLWYSQLTGFLHSVYKSIRKPLFFITGVIIFFSAAYVLQKYPYLLNENNKQLLDFLATLLKMATHL